MLSSTISNIGAALGCRIVHAEGNYITDEQGQTYLDLAMGMGSCFLGHNPREIVEAIKDHIEHYVIGQFFHAQRDRLLSALRSFLPPDFDHVLLSNTGTEAVEVAILLARRLTGHKGIIRLESCFHGKSYLTASLSTASARERMGVPRWPGNIVPFQGRVNSVNFARNLMLFEEALDRFESLLRQHKHRFGAIIVEPIQGTAGNIEVPPELLRRLRDISRREGLLLIADEVASGFGRSGEPFAFHAAGIVPDVIIGGKTISSGYPIGVTILSNSLAAEAGIDRAGMTSTTFGGNSLSCLVAGMVTETIVKKRLWETARTVGKYFRDKLRRLAVTEDNIESVSGRGLMLGVELNRCFSSPDLSHNLSQLLKDRNIICSISGNRIILLPSIRLTRDEIDYFTESLCEAVQQIGAT